MKGIDISSYQGVINFQAVKDSGVEIVYLKATEGRTYQDPNFKNYYNQLKAIGLKCGVYHFLRANSPITSEVDNFLNVVNGLQMDCIDIIDVEITLGQTTEQISSNVRQFADCLISKGRKVGIYTGDNFYANNLNNTVKDLPIWIAHYGVDKPNISNWVGFQYTSSGQVNGINGSVDIDEFTEGILINDSLLQSISQSIPQETLIEKGKKFVGTRCSELQKSLISLGYNCGNGKADGIFGQGTYDSVIKFEQDNHIVVDGLAGSQVFSTLDKLIAQKKQVIQPRPVVKVLIYQKAFNTMGLGSLVTDGILGNLTLGSVSKLPLIQVGSKNAIVGWIQGIVNCNQDSDFGNITKTAVIRYQSYHGLQVDGICGHQTMTYMLIH